MMNCKSFFIKKLNLLILKNFLKLINMKEFKNLRKINLEILNYNLIK